MKNKKWIAAALVCGFVLGNSMPAAQAGILDKVLKGGAIGYAVDATAPALNNAINSVTAKYGVSSTDATKVVPIAAQVSGPQSKVDQVKAALMIEQTLLGVRCKVLIPVDNVSYQNVNRVQGVGVSASLDVKL